MIVQIPASLPSIETPSNEMRTIIFYYAVQIFIFCCIIFGTGDSSLYGLYIIAVFGARLVNFVCMVLQLL